MQTKYTNNNINSSIIYEIASPTFNRDAGNEGVGFFEDGFFTKIAIRSFMVLSITAIAANLRVILEGIL